MNFRYISPVSTAIQVNIWNGIKFKFPPVLLGWRKIDNWEGGGHIFIYIYTAQLISFEIDCSPPPPIIDLPPLLDQQGPLGLYYTARNAQVAASLLQACCLVVIKPISGCVRITCFRLMITSLLQVVNRLDAN